MKLTPIAHPVVGRLVPDQWGDSLMTFRQIPPLMRFVGGLPTDAMNNLGKSDRQLVESWNDVPEKLVKKCRNFEVFDGLRTLGVFEVAFDRTSTGTPSKEQIAAYQYFQEHVEQICGNVIGALLRYYRVARAADKEWLDQNDCPDVSSVDELAPLATLDGVTFTKHHCDGMAVLRFGWNVDWDVEHGLSMAVWKDQVVGIGLEDIHDLSAIEQTDLLVWNRSHMTDTEREHLARVLESIGGPDDDDDTVDEE